MFGRFRRKPRHKPDWYKTNNTRWRVTKRSGEYVCEVQEVECIDMNSTDGATTWKTVYQIVPFGDYVEVTRFRKLPEAEC